MQLREANTLGLIDHHLAGVGRRSTLTSIAGVVTNIRIWPPINCATTAALSAAGMSPCNSQPMKPGSAAPSWAVFFQPFDRHAGGRLRDRTALGSQAEMEPYLIRTRVQREGGEDEARWRYGRHFNWQPRGGV